MRRARVTLPGGRIRKAVFSSAAEPADSWHWLPPVEGTVIGTLLNYRGELDALGDALSTPPYQAPPKTPILYLKPANTRIDHGHDVMLPADVDGVRAGACLGVVIGRTAMRAPTRRAADFIAGHTTINDLTVPYVNYYRPAIRCKCHDGFCPMGPWMVDRDDMPDTSMLDIAMRINDEIKQRTNTPTLVRPIAQLLADVTAFMTLETDDVLLVGMPGHPPLARAGDCIDIDIARIGTLTAALIHHAQEAS